MIAKPKLELFSRLPTRRELGREKVQTARCARRVRPLYQSICRIENAREAGPNSHDDARIADDRQEVTATRAEMAEILGGLIAKLGRRTRERATPAMLDGDRQSYVIDDMIEAIKAGSTNAEAKAAERQAARQAAKKKGSVDHG